MFVFDCEAGYQPDNGQNDVTDGSVENFTAHHLRRDFDQIHALFYGDILCLLNRQNAELFAVVTDQTNFLVADLFIDLMFHAADW